MVVEHDVVLSAVRSDLTVETAGDILWTLNNPELFVTLVIRCKWPGLRFEQWLAESMCSSLLEPA